jgi:hypothetical protein
MDIKEKIRIVRQEMMKIQNDDRNFYVNREWKSLQKELKQLIKEEKRLESGFSNDISVENQKFLDREQKTIDDVINELMELKSWIKNQREFLKTEYKNRNLKCSQSERIYNQYSDIIRALSGIK